MSKLKPKQKRKEIRWAVLLPKDGGLAVVSWKAEGTTSWKDMASAIFESKVGANAFSRGLQAAFRGKIKVVPVLITY
jgi:hypothetical protein